MNIITEKYGPVLAQIGKPLQFFALALLIVETLVAILSVHASSELLQNLLVAGTGMFVLVVLMVVLIIFKKPKVLLAQHPDELLDDIKEVSKIEKQVRKVQKDNTMIRKIFESKRIGLEQKLSIPSDTEKRLEPLIKKQLALQKSIKESIDDYAVNIDVLMRNASFYYYAKKYKKAIELYDVILKEDPTDTAALNNKGNALFQLGRYEEAIGCFDAALAIDPKDVNALSNKGMTLNDVGRYEEAIRCLDEALAIDPTDTAALGNKGNAFSKLGRYEEAIGCFDEVLAINPKDANAVYNKSCTYTLMENTSKAFEFLKKAITMDSEYKETAKGDKDFQNIRGKPEFKKLVES